MPKWQRGQQPFLLKPQLVLKLSPAQRFLPLELAPCGFELLREGAPLSLAPLTLHLFPLLALCLAPSRLSLFIGKPLCFAPLLLVERLTLRDGRRRLERWRRVRRLRVRWWRLYQAASQSRLQLHLLLRHGLRDRLGVASRGLLHRCCCYGGLLLDRL